MEHSYVHELKQAVADSNRLLSYYVHYVADNDMKEAIKHQIKANKALITE
jgi:hypothetical protein